MFKHMLLPSLRGKCCCKSWTGTDVKGLLFIANGSSSNSPRIRINYLSQSIFMVGHLKLYVLETWQETMTHNKARCRNVESFILSVYRYPCWELFLILVALEAVDELSKIIIYHNFTNKATKRDTVPSDTIQNPNNNGGNLDNYNANATRSRKLLQSEVEKVVELEPVELEEDAPLDVPNVVDELLITDLVVVEVDSIPGKSKAPEGIMVDKVIDFPEVEIHMRMVPAITRCH
ncbi:hypothetical protein RND71_038426 [Anisodus tanguticus]|uniref:Uncharacterized protein n=1 Tax=Anisodus tanguticus TaxID=243964 RepID=A0AAE1UZG6_9SOLA|nr:hypothetical protein RND71_038426 [Anisodus tanguticus]